MSSPASWPVSFRSGPDQGLRVGDTVVEPGFLATSADARVASENFAAAQLVAVAGRTGRYLGPVSQVPAEEEVVYGQGVQLTVVALGEVDHLPVLITVVRDGSPAPDPDALVRQVIAQVRAARALPPVELARTGRFRGPVGG